VHLILLLAATLAAKPAASIETTIRGTAQPLRVELLKRNADEKWEGVARRGLTAEEKRVRFDGLEAGVYQIRIRGAAEGEQLARKIIIGSRDARRLEVDITPFELTGRVTQGGAPLGPAALVLRNDELQWTATLPVAADGSFHTQLWERGDYFYSVKSTKLTKAFSERTRIAGASPVRLALEVPAGVIAGVVRDAKSGAPLPGLSVSLMTRLDEEERHVQTMTDASGAFRLNAVRDGQQTVSISAGDHLEPEPFVFDFGPAGRTRELDIRLQPGRTIPILVLGSERTPAERALVFSLVDGVLRARAFTDEDGRANIAVPEGETATLFAIGPNGGFGVRRVTREERGERLRIELPRAESSLSIQARTTDGQPMPPFSLLMRYNGEIVPPEVGEALTEAIGLQLATSAESEAMLRNIPTGSYEFWPYRTEAEAESIVASGATFAAPIQVNVRSGENRIAVKFKSRT